MCLVLGWWILRKDREHALEIANLRTACDAEKKALLNAFVGEKDGRIKDAQGFTGLSIQLQRDVMTYVSEAKIQDARIVENIGGLAIKIGEHTKAVEQLTAWVIDKKGSAP